MCEKINLLKKKITPLPNPRKSAAKPPPPPMAAAAILFLMDSFQKVIRLSEILREQPYQI